MADETPETPRPRRVKKAPPKRGFLARVARFVLLSGLGAGALSLIAAGILGWLYHRHVVVDPGPHIARAHIEAIIAQESPVYYRDGVTRIGVFFEDEHRQYVPFDELPQAYVMGLVASEDAGFWTHPGVSPKHIVRAVIDNLSAGDVVSGGSTLTQQTAKNLYYRPDRSFKSKWTELINALRLEAHYSKQDILTFYVNQFHVSGNGRGLGIAARYFFDKEVDALTVLESAFLAGLVKAPAHYDPFLGDEAKRKASTERAHARTRYVLQRITVVPAEDLAGPLPGRDAASGAAYAARVVEARKVQAEAQRLLDDGFTLDFRRGTFRYDSSAVLDEVARRLSEPPFDEVLAAAGIADPATAGLRVITTLDPAVEREAIYGLWHHLTEAGVMLEGKRPEDFIRADSKPPRYAPEHPPRPHEFRLAAISEVLDPAGKPHFMADLGGYPCTIDREAVIRAAVAVYRGEKKDRTVKAPTATVDAFVAAIPKGSVVWVSVRSAPAGKTAICDLELRPELQGSVVVIEDGQVRAMIGGNDNRNFNRSTALRQMGSTWKILVYHSAMQLGWGPLDELDNRRNVFPFSTTFYYPKPDHTPVPVVSMSWAGVHSENLASIWLLYHLTDRLDGEQIRELAGQLDMAPREGESEKAYKDRIQRLGVLPTPRRVEEGLFLQARQEVAAGLAAEGHRDDALPLASLTYGWGVATERARVEKSEPAGSRAWMLRALDNSWVRLEGRMTPCADQHRHLARAFEGGEIPDPRLVPDLSLLVDGDWVEVACGTMPEGYVPVRDALGDLPGYATGEEPPTPLVVKPGKRRPRVVKGGAASAPRRVLYELADDGDMLIDDRLHLATLRAIEASMARRRIARESGEAPGLYDPEVLYWHQDFRVLLGMRYVAALAQEYGVQTEIREVLSMPLGASEITLEEATLAYEGVTTGLSWSFPGHPGALPWPGAPSFDTPAASTLLIAEIRDVDDNVLYRAEPVSRRVAPEPIGAMTSDILVNVVGHGTGTRASGLLKEGDGVIPIGGKTGTTNDFKNVAFLGFVPRATSGGYTTEGGFTVGVYVGYDDNRPMESGRIKLAGASGALPPWMATVKGIHDAGLLGTPTGAPIDGKWPLLVPRDLTRVAVDPASGLRADASTTSVLAPPEAARVAELDIERPRRPVRMAPSTEDIERLLERKRVAKERASVWDQP